MSISKKPIIVLSINDAENQFISDLAKKFKVECLDCKLDWGEKLTSDHPLYKKLFALKVPAELVLIEMPDPDLENRLAAMGHSVVIIDHHTISLPTGKHLDRIKNSCSAEQIVSHFGWNLKDKEKQELRLIAANDTGSWFGMMRELAETPAKEALKKAQKIFDEEQKLRRKISKKLSDKKTKKADICIKELTTGLKSSGHRKFTLIHGIERDIAYRTEEHLKELAIKAHENAEGAISNIAYPELMAIGFDPEYNREKITSLYFTCGSAGVPIIRDIIKLNPVLPDANLLIVSGGTQERAYLYAIGSHAKLSQLADVILDNCLTGVKPLRAYQTSFFQAISVDEKELFFKHGYLEEGSPKVFNEAALGLENLKVENKPTSQNKLGLIECDASVRNYFLPALRNGMTPSFKVQCDTLTNLKKANATDVQPILSWNIPIPDGAVFKIYPICDNTQTSKSKKLLLREPLKGIILHRGFDGVYFLEWKFGNREITKAEKVKSKKEKEKNENKENSKEEKNPSNSTWQYLTHHAFKPTKYGIRGIKNTAQLLDFNYAARMCYSAGMRGSDEQRCITLEIGENTYPLCFGIGEQESTQLRGWFKQLVKISLGPLIKYTANVEKVDLNKSNVRLILDERARFVSSLVPIGSAATLPGGIARWEVVRARFAGGDEYSDWHFYDAGFALEELERGTYRRFQNNGSLHQATSHSFSMLAFGGFANDISYGNMQNHYARMFLVLQLNVCTFQNLWREQIKSASDPKISHTKREKRALEQRSKMVHFSNAFWFQNLSSQLQGQELYHLMHKELTVDREHQDLNQEIENTELLIANEQAKRAESSRDHLAWGLAIFGTFISLLEVTDKWTSWKKSAIDPKTKISVCDNNASGNQGADGALDHIANFLVPCEPGWTIFGIGVAALALSGLLFGITKWQESKKP